jgi:hypothetical protein
MSLSFRLLNFFSIATPPKTITTLGAVTFLALSHSVFAKTLLVGPGKTYASPAAAAADVANGDTVLIDPGEYTDQATTWRANNLVLKATAKFAKLTPPETISNGKAIWVTMGSNITVENIEFTESKVNDENGAGIRAEGRNLTVIGCYFHHNENGILGGVGVVRIERSEFAHNGLGDPGYTHNLYIGEADTLIFLYNYSHHAHIGHELKSRAKVNLIANNRLMNESDGNASYTIDLPNGGTSWVIGNLLQQGSKTDNSNLMHFGGEGLKHPGKDLYLSHNTLVNERGSGGFLSLAGGATCASYNNLVIGSGSIPTTCTGEGNVTAARTAVVDADAFDYRLPTGSPALNAGVDLSAIQGADFSLVAHQHYVHKSGGAPRTTEGKPDAGAYEGSPESAPLLRSPRKSLLRSRPQNGQPAFAFYWPNGQVFSRLPTGGYWPLLTEY